MSRKKKKKKVAGDRGQALQRKRQELQANLLCPSARVSPVSSLGFFPLPTLWEGIFSRLFHLHCGCTGAMGWRHDATRIGRKPGILAQTPCPGRWSTLGGLLPERPLSPPGLMQPPPTGLIVHLGSPQMLYQINHCWGNLPQRQQPKWRYFQEIRGDGGRDLGQTYAEGDGREARHPWACRGPGKEHGHGGIWEGQQDGRGDGGNDNVEDMEKREARLWEWARKSIKMKKKKRLWLRLHKPLLWKTKKQWKEIEKGQWSAVNHCTVQILEDIITVHSRSLMRHSHVWFSLVNLLVSKYYPSTETRCKKLHI